MAVAQREGVWGTARLLLRYTRVALGVPSAQMRAWEQQRVDEAAAFDGARGLDTGGTVQMFDLTVASPNAAHAGPYIAAGPDHFRAAMALVDGDVAGSTFVDLGSGKGRALLLAAQYPFAAIVGVEFAAELHAICCANIARFGDARISNRLGDAEQFAWPAGPLVVFLNNPFDAPLLARVVERLTATLRAHPRWARVVYLNPAAPELFREAGWRVVADEGSRTVFALDG